MKEEILKIIYSNLDDKSKIIKIHRMLAPDDDAKLSKAIAVPVMLLNFSDITQDDLFPETMPRKQQEVPSIRKFYAIYEKFYKEANPTEIKFRWNGKEHGQMAQLVHKITAEEFEQVMTFYKACDKERKQGRKFDSTMTYIIDHIGPAIIMNNLNYMLRNSKKTTTGKMDFSQVMIKGNQDGK